jgi:signal peptidase II
MKLTEPDIRTARIAAAAAIVVALGLDIAIKRLILAMGADWNGVVLLPGLLDLHYAWNRGVSFSFLWQSTTLGSILLTVVLSGFAAVFAVAAFRTDRALLACGFGLVVGGALGNLADRALEGAVFDFLVVRLGAQPLFVCNSADVFISLGVICWLADMLLTPQPAAASEKP